MEEFWTWICSHIGLAGTAAAIILTAFVEITPIKLNPWTAIKNFFTAPSTTLRAIDNIKADLETQKNKIEEIDAKVQQIGIDVTISQQNIESIQRDVEKTQIDLNNFKMDVKNESDKKRAEECRIRILKFGDEITHGVIHSKEHYEQTLSDIGYYDNYCATHPEFPNHITVINSQIINDKYKQLFYSTDFTDREDD